jgi:hypothetical protein
MQQSLLEPIDEEGRRLLERRGKIEVDEKDPLKRRFYERHQIGGKPYWIVKEEETPICSRCGQVMTFLAQFDSLSPEISFGENGVVYVFYRCFEARGLDCAILLPRQQKDHSREKKEVRESCVTFIDERRALRGSWGILGR